jgi:glutathione synthase/RimK-type ligase-like ATP-grasp enzyme
MQNAPANRVAILTPEPREAAASDGWRGVLDRADAALAQAGIDTVATPWTAHAEDCSQLLEHALVLPLLAWGYHLEHARWLQACRLWRDVGVRIANPPSVLADNSDKRYLATLERAGIAIPPTAWTDRVDQAQVDAMFDATGAASVIVKPTVSGGAWKTLRLGRGDPLDDAPTGAAMIQPYLPTIETEGETSLLFFDGRFSHAVNKRPAAGDFRIQSEHGGVYHAVAPPPGAMALARQVLDAIGTPLLYARIDLVPDARGRWLLMEAELIEPEFFLREAPDHGAMFAAAVRARLASARLDHLPAMA